MIRDTRQIFATVSVEILKELLVSAGTYGGLPVFYSYPPNSKKLNYELKYFLEFWEIEEIFSQISNFGYNQTNILSADDIIGNITNLSIGDIIYIAGKEFFQCSVSVTKYPNYQLPDFIEEINYENQTKIGGFYLDGSVYLDKMDNYGLLTKKTVTINYNDINLPEYEVTPRKLFGQSLNKFTLSVNSSNLKFIIDDSNTAHLYTDLEITEVS
jgi:hypothetical protein